jgi:hypothetical protein
VDSTAGLEPSSTKQVVPALAATIGVIVDYLLLEWSMPTLLLIETLSSSTFAAIFVIDQQAFSFPSSKSANDKA